VSCVCELILLFSVVLYPVRAVRKFYRGRVHPKHVTYGVKWNLTQGMTET